MRNQFTQAIGELRGKLIDTSRRNKLINYRRPSKSTNLKIIDESAEFIFNYLVNEENKFKFKFIPEPKLDVIQKIDKGRIAIRNVSKDVGINSGDLWVTTNDVAEVPSGLIVGVVKTSRISDDQGFQELEIDPQFDLSETSYLFIEAKK